jgi:probable 2-oxoglutarate dehydrogenase E1 component DHKTD1
LAELAKAKVLTLEEGAKIVEQYTAKLGKALQQVDTYLPPVSYFTGRWFLFRQAESSVTTWDTGLDTNLLQFIGRKSVEYEDELVKDLVATDL